jgi:hypothetical protein
MGPTSDPTSDQLRERILAHLRGHAGDVPAFGLADFHAEVMKDAFPSEKGTPQRTFSKRALYDEALDELIEEGFIERREGGRLFLTEKGRAPH